MKKNWLGILVIILIFGMTVGCDIGANPSFDQSPGIGQQPSINDFNIGGIGKFAHDGNQKFVTVIAKAGKTNGAVIIRYNENTTAPSAVGFYIVTFDVAADTGWDSAKGLFAGVLEIYDSDTTHYNEKYVYKINNGLVTIIYRYSNSESEWVVPNEIDSYPVAYLGNYNEEYGVYYPVASEIDSVIIPSSVVEISENAFDNYWREHKLKTITFSEGLELIGERAFSGNDLTSVSIPSSVTTIGHEAFAGNKLKTVDILGPAEIKELAFYNNEITSLQLGSVTFIGEYAFQSNKLTSLTIPPDVEVGLRAFYDNNLTTLIISQSCSIGEEAFRENNLVQVDILGAVNIGPFAFVGNKISVLNWAESEGESVIGNFAFNSNELTGHLKIPDSVVSIGELAFYENKISSVIIGVKVTTIGAEAFASKPDLVGGQSNFNALSGHLIIPDSVTYIGDYAFEFNQLTGITIGNNVVYIGNNAFAHNKLTGTLTLPDGLTHIGNLAFGTSRFEEEGAFNQLNGTLIIPNSVSYIGASAFRDNEFSGTLNIPNSVTFIGERAFQTNKFSGTLIIPNSITVLEELSFAQNQFTAVSIPASVNTIGEQAFAGCFLTTLVIPDNVETIARGAFYNNLLTDVTFGNGVTFIGGLAFSYNAFTSLVIPDNITKMDDEAFYNCGFWGTGLNSVVIGNGITSIGVSVFSNNNLTTVTIPNSVTFIGMFAFRNNSLASITIPDSVRVIDCVAFEGNSLISITIGADVNLVIKSLLEPLGEYPPFHPGFVNLYNNNGKLAGTYTRIDDSSAIWIREEQ